VRQWHATLTSTEGVSRFSSAAKAYRLLSTIMKTAVEDELIARSPCIVKGAGIERAAERPVISIDQVAVLVSAVEPRYRAMIILSTWAGLRFGELAQGLRRSDIDLH
jgi:integrase